MTYEALLKTIPSEDMWPINEFWDYHCGSFIALCLKFSQAFRIFDIDELFLVGNSLGLFGNLDYFTSALVGRYGVPTSAEDYLQKAQLMAYEGHRAMFEVRIV